MLARISPAVKEYLICCVPVANILAHSKVVAPIELGVNPDKATISKRIKEAADKQARFFTSYTLGVLTQAAIAISSFALAVICAPVAPTVTLFALASSFCFGISALTSIPAYVFQSKIQVAAYAG